MSALQLKPVPSRLGKVLGGGREDLVLAKYVPGWTLVCYGECCADTMRW